MLLTAAVAAMLVLLAHHHAALRRRLSRGAVALVLAGTQVPLIDLPWRYWHAADRIAFLASPSHFYAFYPAMLLIGGIALLSLWMRGVAPARRVALALGTGWLLHMLLLLFTPVGLFPLWPFGDWRVALPVFPAGYPLPALALLLLLVLAELLQRQRRWLFAGGWGLLATYVLGMGGYATYTYALARADAAPEAHVLLLPANVWPTRGNVILEQRGGYVAWPPGDEDASDGDADEAAQMPMPRASQSNDLASVLQDPIIRAFYYRLFRAPVINITAGNSQTTVVMREFTDIDPPVPGRTLLIESSLDGRSRVYELKHFN